jgi:putative transposase
LENIPISLKGARNTLHGRRSIRLKDYDYSQPGAYFITVCTKDHDCILGEIVDGEIQLSEFGKIALKHWDEIPKYFPSAELDEFIVMPNHIHGIIVLHEPVGAIHESPLQMTRPQRRKMVLPGIIGKFKMIAAKEINTVRHTAGSPVWQRNYFERIIRDDKELNNIREYIVNNPLKWREDKL